jgi:hypothetical protein
VSTSAADAGPVESITASAYIVPTDQPESEGTLAWDSTTLVLVEAEAAGHRGVGYTYAGAAAAEVVTGKLAEVVAGRAAGTPVASWTAMQHAVRNLGKPGLVATAISAVDIALWDLAARLHGLPLSLAIGAVHDGTPVYGSGGCDARSVDLSLHCAPQISAHVGCAVWHLRHLEYFHDHVRIEAMAFDGVREPSKDGVLRPDRRRPGTGLEIRHADLEPYRVA